ncbi:hypothetical protein EMPG_15274 [Blastomyces silverae]|uniref:Uncharacterized protein n=1 Tax=Blastomyces silverae TaxID=2060906 RepID=A0A0H1BD09_9EURO|nr:hypothetical protein EMPG_15274 [Blastomyces silverae]
MLQTQLCAPRMEILAPRQELMTRRPHLPINSSIPCSISRTSMAPAQAATM